MFQPTRTRMTAELSSLIKLIPGSMIWSLYRDLAHVVGSLLDELGGFLGVRGIARSSWWHVDFQSLILVPAVSMKAVVDTGEEYLGINPMELHQL